MTKIVKNGELKGGASTNNLQTALQEAAVRLASKKPPELKLPPKNRPDMSALDLLDLQEEDANQQDREIAPRVGEWMENDSLPNLDKIEAKVKKLGPKVLELVSGEDESGQKITFKQQMAEYTRLNAEYLCAAFQIGETGAGEPFLLPAMETRKAAHMAVLKHRLRKEVDREELIDLVAICMKDGYFVEHQEGLIRIWQRKYMLSDKENFGGLGEAEERLLAEIVGNHISRINSAYEGQVAERSEELKNKASKNFGLNQLLAGEAGVCFVHAPKEVRNNYKLSEVYLLVEGDGTGRAFISDAVGTDEETALAIKNHKLFLWLPTLDIPRPPRIETLTNKGFSEEDAKLLQHFWGYLDRARRVHEQREKRERDKELADKAKQEQEEMRKKAFEEANQLKEELAGQQTVSIDRVLLELQLVEGIFYGEFAEDWRNPDGSIVPKGLLYFLAEQKVVDGKPQMKIKRAPSHLANGKFFVEANMEFTPYEQFFKGLEQPMQGLMKAMHRQVKNLMDSTV